MVVINLPMFYWLVLIVVIDQRLFIGAFSFHVLFLIKLDRFLFYHLDIESAGRRLFLLLWSIDIYNIILPGEVFFP